MVQSVYKLINSCFSFWIKEEGYKSKCLSNLIIICVCQESINAKNEYYNEHHSRSDFCCFPICKMQRLDLFFRILENFLESLELGFHLVPSVILHLLGRQKSLKDADPVVGLLYNSFCVSNLQRRLPLNKSSDIITYSYLVENPFVFFL